MTIQALRDQLGDHAKDIRLNLGSVLTVEGAPDLSLNQIHGIALASAYATRNQTVIAAILAENTLSDAEANAAKAAASIMAMNNIYYRFVHLVEDKEYSKMPARLRMNVIAAPGIAKVDFELFSLAVSAINGCGMCMEAHVHEVIKAGISKQGVQSAIRIAAVINAAAQGLV
ncbi:MAG: carboxymuconolactone decarboxylase family protein [Alphaproteobacteria bacterium]